MDSIQSSRVFGEYIIKRKLGAGGMASVFYAVHTESEDEVALKILHEHYADDSMIRKRLEHEARIVMRLKHPHIVPVLSFGEYDKRPYLVMPYYSGGSLAEYFSKPRAVKHETSLKLLAILASALDYAHSQEVVHRDFKLENILIGQNNLPAISDFGIAQSAHTTRITMTGQILGTPQYLAPENLDTNGRLNYRADLYALAVMAYLMLTGYFPFTAQDPLNLAIKHRTEHAPSPSIVNPQLPSTLDPVLGRGLAKNPDERYPSAKEFVEALHDALSYAALVTTQILIMAQNPIPPTQALTAQGGIMTPDNLNPDALVTKVLPHDELIPAAAPVTVVEARKKKRRSPAYLIFLTVLLCTGISLAFFMMNSGSSMLLSADEDGAEASPEASAESSANANSESTAQFSFLQAVVSIQGRLQSQEAEASEESSAAASTSAETATSRSSSTARASSTSSSGGTATASSASSTATTRASNTSAATNTSQPLPTNTPRPLPTNTPQPQPTSVPPTNPPAPTAVPPTNAPAPTNPPNNGGGGVLDPVLNPVDTLIPCVPVPLVHSCP